MPPRAQCTQRRRPRTSWRCLFGNRLTETDPLQHSTNYTYSPLQQVLTVTDPLNNTTTNAYDNNGNLLTTKDALGNVTTNTYSPNGLLATTQDALHNTTSFGYDGSGNLTSLTDANNVTASYTYDANGNRQTQSVTRTLPASQGGGTQTLLTQFAYDGNNRLTKTTYPDGTFTQVQYNSLGQQAATIDAKNNTTSYTYDNDGRLTLTKYPDGTTESSTYDGNGNRLTSTDRAGHVTTYTYDAVNRLTETTYADNSLTQTGYDAAGQVLTSEDANGNVTTYAYDDAGRRTTLTDALTHVTAFGYDALDRLALVTDANGATSYGYDAVGNLQTVTCPNGVVHSYSYDSRNRLTGLNVAPGSSSPALFNYVYTLDAAGHRTSVTEQSGRKVSYGYDTIYHLTNETIASDPNGMNGAVSYTYDNVGNRLQKTSTLPGFPGASSTYNANDELTTDQYDSDGNTIGSGLNTGTSGYVGACPERGRGNFENRLVQQAGISIVYDGDGNRRLGPARTDERPPNRDARSQSDRANHGYREPVPTRSFRLLACAFRSRQRVWQQLDPVGMAAFEGIRLLAHRNP